MVSAVGPRGLVPFKSSFLEGSIKAISAEDRRCRLIDRSSVLFLSICEGESLESGVSAHHHLAQPYTPHHLS